MSKPESYPSSAEVRASELLERMSHTLAEAVMAVEPENSGHGPLEVFPEPGQRRADTEFSLAPDQETAFRKAMAELGIGRETNINASEAGLQPGYFAIIEGGQAHKMKAELNLVLSDKNTPPGAIIIAATPERLIPEAEQDKVGEKQITARVLGIPIEQVGRTEYDVARQVALSTPEVKETATTSIRYRYDMEGNVEAGNNDGQLYLIGKVGADTGVYLLRVDRDYPDPENPRKYITLGPGKLMKVVDGFLSAINDGSEIGFITSATYQPSREVDAAGVMLEIERQGLSRNVGVLTYGTAELAAVKGEPASQPSLGQLAGEAHKAAVAVLALRDLLANETEPEPQDKGSQLGQREWDIT